MKPINMKTWEVQALLADRKIVARRVIKPHNAMKAKHCGYCQGDGLWIDDELNEWDKDTHIKDYSVSPCWIGTQIYIRDYAPYRPGNILYVRETFCQPAKHIYWYKADSKVQNVLWRPSIHMPKEAARLFLRVTDIRVERLQDITTEEAIKEGVDWRDVVPVIMTFDNMLDEEVARQQEYQSRKLLQDSFGKLWDATLKPKDRPLYGWDVNPWIWRVEFERISKDEVLQ